MLFPEVGPEQPCTGDILKETQLLERLLKLRSFSALDLTETEMTLNHFWPHSPHLYNGTKEPDFDC